MNRQYALPTNPATVRIAESWTRPWQGIPRRLRAIVRLVSRRRRARRRFLDLTHLDDRTLRDLGITRSELSSVVAELGGQAAATRRRTDAEVWRSASWRFRARAVDSSF